MDGREQSDLVKEISDFHDTFNQNAKHYKKEKTSIKVVSVENLNLVFVI